jgi:hypothetical protein
MEEGTVGTTMIVTICLSVTKQNPMINLDIV